MNEIKYPTIEDMAGMGDATAAWHCLRDISGQNSAGLAVAPGSITVQGDRFVLSSSGVQVQETEQVTSLAESVFLLLIGRRPQKIVFSNDSHETPEINPGVYGYELSSLLKRMLDSDEKSRPNLEEVRNLAESKCAELDSRPYERTKEQGRSNEVRGFWPEVMRSITLLSVFLFSVSSAFSQDGISTEMESLIHHALSLRTDSKSAIQSFAQDTLWTLMDELDESEGECTEDEEVSFHGFNRRATNIFISRSKVVMNSPGNFCSGEDAKYNYSIIELTVKKGDIVSYSMKKRKGHQTIAVVPYKGDIKLEAKVENAQAEPYGDGVTLFRLDNVSETEPIEVSIKNASDRNASFILINHNSRM